MNRTTSSYGKSELSKFQLVMWQN